MNSLMRSFIPFGLLTLLAACATSGKPPAMTAAGTAASGQGKTLMVQTGTKTADENKLICTQSVPLGTHLPQRICLTKAQMAARQKAAQEAMRNMQNEGAIQEKGGG